MRQKTASKFKPFLP